MQQAIAMSELKYGPCLEWEYESIDDYEDPEQAGKNYDISKAFVEQYLEPFMKLKSEKKEWITSTQQKLDGYSLVFADGSTMNAKVGSCVDLSFDINGDRKPNKRGYDQFIFVICKRDSGRNNKQCFTSYFPAKTREKNLDNCKSNSYYCSSLLQWDNWEFKDDYPYKL